MSREQDHPHPTDMFGFPEGLLAAILAALLLIAVFGLHVFAVPMPPTERWASLTTFALLALATTLPGCAAAYDALGQAVRRDLRALAALLALGPTLYTAYAWAVRELTGYGFLAALLITVVPTLAIVPSRTHRQPTLFDAIGLSYLILSFGLQLLPPLTLPQQRGVVGFFPLMLTPLLLTLFAARGWPGLGFTWHLSGRELRDALTAGLLALVLSYGAAMLLTGASLSVAHASNAATFVLMIVQSYFFAALPLETLLRGGVQNGLARTLAGRAGPHAPWIALLVGALLTAPVGPVFLRRDALGLIAGAIIGVAAGWSYLRTGKVTASAISSAVVALGLQLTDGG